MRICPTTLKHKNKLIEQYRTHDEKIIPYFDYMPFDSLEQRIIDLKNRKFQRQDLMESLYEMNQLWGAPAETLQNIKKLTDEDSVVVIGGQQAGLLTGPMYTVNKIISIILFAKEQEKKLHVPVIPVFWIAGEDHDYDEINHIYTNQLGKLKKHNLQQSVLLKKSISHVKMDKQQMEKWLGEIFQQLKETPNTRQLLHKVSSCLTEANTFVDFFARLIFQLFPSEGVVLVDSANSTIRQLESEMFSNIIHHQSSIAQTVFDTSEKLRQEGYTLSLDVAMDDAHLFYHDTNNERILLKRNGNDWVGKNDEVLLTTDELEKIAKESPEKLSNNVITRPFMQEYLFPTLAFIGGDGEISYWATLKNAFHVLGMKMPPVIPRLSMTFINDRTKKILAKLALEPTSVLNSDVAAMKYNWLLSKQQPPLPQLMEQMKEDFTKSHHPIREFAASVSPDLGQLANKNLENILHQLSFLENKLLSHLRAKHALEMDYYNKIELAMKPNGVLQERVWSPIEFINDYGIQFIKNTLTRDLSFKEDHYLIYLN